MEYLKYFTLFLFVVRFLYWILPTLGQNLKSPPQEKIKDYVIYGLWLLVGLQLADLVNVLEFEAPYYLSLLGFSLAIIGVVISLAGKYSLAEVAGLMLVRPKF